MARQVGSLFVKLSLQNDLNQGLTAARSELSNLGTSFQRAGARVSGFGRSMMVATLPLAGALGGAVFAAGRFDTAMANTGSLIGATREEMSGISAEILALGSTSLAGPQAAAEAYFDIVSGVADASTHMAILEAAMNTSEAGAADLGATTSVLVGLMNAYNQEASGASITSDILTSTVQNGVLTMDELAAALPTVTALAAASGIGFDELAGSVALITKGGSSASVATTQLRGAMLAFLNPNTRMVEALNELGFQSGSAALETLGLQGALQAVSGTAAVAENGLAGTVGGAEALGAALELTKDGSAAFLANFSGDMTDAQQSMFDMIREAEGMQAALAFETSLDLGFTGATAEAQAVQLESFGAKMALVKSQIQGLAIVIGNALLPAIIDVVDEVTPLVQAFADWAVENPALLTDLVKLVGLLIVLGPVLMVVGRIVSAVGTAFNLLKIAILAISSPLALAVLGGVALGVLLFTKWDEIKEVFFAVGKAIGELGTTITSELSEAVTTFVNTAGSVFMEFWDFLKQDIDVIKEKFVSFGTGLFTIFAIPFVIAGIVIKEVVSSIATKIGDLGGVVALMAAPFVLAYIVIKDVLSRVVGLINDIAGALGIDWGVILGGLEQAFAVTMRGIMAVINPILAAINAITSFLGSDTAGITGVTTKGNKTGESTETPTGAVAPPIPGNARGGPVTAGVPTFVGERGMELFVPSSNGRIIPNNALGGGGGAMNVNVLNVYANDPEDLYDKLMKIQKRRAQ